MADGGVGREPRSVPDRLPSRVMASWQRSEEYGVPPDVVDPLFAGTYDQESLFFRCGREVLTALHRTLAAEPISLMLTDADGLVLNRLSGDHALLRALDTVHLAPGFAYAERQAGTNGLGLALADRVPAVVHAEEHYSASLRGYTCAAAPVVDPLSGRLEGSVNLTTWSDSSSDLLLALAQAAAGNTAALMLARSHGRTPWSAPPGEVLRVETPQLEPGLGTLRDLSLGWQGALGEATEGLRLGHVVMAVGEYGSGRTTLLAQALRDVRPRDRILAASAPSPADPSSWLALWTPELGKAHTAAVVRDVGTLPIWVAERLRDLVGAGQEVPFTLTAESYADVPAPLAGLVDTVVEVPPLRERPEDVVPLADAIARSVRGREVSLSPPAARALRDHSWPGNVAELRRVIRRAASVTDHIDVRHLPAELLADGGRHLTRIETFERDEIIRVLTRPGLTVRDAAEELGMSRATIYRKVQQYGIRLPR